MRLALVLLLALQSAIAFSGSSGLVVKVSGDISPAPRFVNTEGTMVSVLQLSFQGTAKDVVNEAVDSTPITVRLVDAIAYPAQVAFQRPQGCQIGSQSITDSSVQLQANGEFYGADGLFSIPSNAAVSIGLRFLAASSLSGAVLCVNDGGIIYSY